jgi:hypothetical protein
VLEFLRNRSLAAKTSRPHQGPERALVAVYASVAKRTMSGRNPTAERIAGAVDELERVVRSRYVAWQTWGFRRMAGAAAARLGVSFSEPELLEAGVAHVLRHAICDEVTPDEMQEAIDFFEAYYADSGDMGRLASKVVRYCITGRLEGSLSGLDLGYLEPAEFIRLSRRLDAETQIIGELCDEALS